MPGVWDPFEVGVRAIVGQQVSVAGASTITGRLVERAGTAVPGLTQFGLTHVFPTPATLATADLTGIGLTGARIAAIRGFAHAVATGSLRLDRSLTLEELVAATVAVPGLGPWTANYLALRMGEADAFPAGDLGLRRGIERLTGSAGSAPRRCGYRRALAPVAGAGCDPSLAQPVGEFPLIRSQSGSLHDHVPRARPRL